MDDAVLTVLEDADSVSVTTLPDGSVDRRYRVVGSDGTALARSAFTAELDAGARSFRLERISTAAGGMAVNAAIQANALGARTRLAGHLDDPVFDDLEFPRVSMGRPADVNIYEFAESAIMLSDESPDLDTWSFRDLEAVLGDRRDDWLTADATVCSNWVSLDNMTDALETLASLDLAGGWFVVDPGDVRVRSAADTTEFLRALGALESSFDVVLNPNAGEVRAIGRALDLHAASVTDLLPVIRERAGITGAAVHTVPAAAVATRDRTFRVPNYDTRGLSRFTGAGDRFSGALAVALATGATWPVALELANACATYYVVSSETATRSVLADFPDVTPDVRRPG